jgi:hypothetical protein
MHEALSIRNTTVTHQNHELVDGLSVLGGVIPESRRFISMSEMRRRVSLLRVDENGGTLQDRARRTPVCCLPPNLSVPHQP